MSTPALTPTLEQLAQTYSDLQTKLISAETGFQAMKIELEHTKQAPQAAQV